MVHYIRKGDNSRDYTEKDFKEGDKVYYDIFPHDINILGTIFLIRKGNEFGNSYDGKLGIQSHGKHRQWFIRHGVADTVPFEDCDDVRPRKKGVIK